jgi:hypothetical protein
MTATLPSLDPYTTGPKSLIFVFTRGITGLRHGPAIDQLEGAALQEHFGRGEWRTYHVLQGHAFAEVGGKGP